MITDTTTFDVTTARRLAEQRMPAAVTAFVNCEGTGGALQANLDAWADLAVRPRVFVDVSESDTSTTVLGQRIELPVIVSPFALATYCDPDAELGVAAAAARAGTRMTLSMGGTMSPEEIGGVGPFWLHLEELGDRAPMTDYIQRGIAAGASAICFTVSRPIQPLWSSVMLDALFDLGFATRDELAPEVARASSRRTFTWDDLDWLRDVCPLPLVLKGVQTAEDARLASERGVDAILVSNHGGFMCDETIGTAAMLEEIAGSVDGRTELLVDGGIRTGADVFRALALGARAAMIGRPALWGIAAGGADGCARVLEAFRDELAVTMAMAGARRVDEIGPTSVQHRGPADRR
jgi:4-hydroxymandelate oxidase